MQNRDDDPSRSVKGIIERISRLDTYVHTIASDVASEVDAMVYLRQTLGPSAYIPPAGGWAAQYKTIAYLVGEILENQDLDDVTELGSGVSTVWMGLALQARGRGHLTSVEHDPHYRARTNSFIQAHGLERIVTLRHAPLKDLVGGGGTWYEVDTVRADLPQSGLLFIDGPPAVSDPQVRFPAIEHLHEHLRDQSLIVLDDFDRQGERDIVERWTATGGPGWRLVQEDVVGRSVVLRLHTPLRGKP